MSHVSDTVQKIPKMFRVYNIERIDQTSPGTMS